MLARHPATRGYRCHWDVETAVPYSTAGKSVVWDVGGHVLVSKDTEGKLMTIEYRLAKVRRSLMAVKPMAQQGQWVCFGLHRAFAYKIEKNRVIPFESTPNEWNLTVELEAPPDANSKLQEVMDIMMTETLRTDGEYRTHDRIASCGREPTCNTKRTIIGTVDSDGDETMMDLSRSRVHMKTASARVGMPFWTMPCMERKKQHSFFMLRVRMP